MKTDRCSVRNYFPASPENKASKAQIIRELSSCDHFLKGKTG